MGGYVSSYITEAHRKTVRGDEMALERFIILLDNADAAYFPGQTVTGVVHIWNGRTKTLKGIYAECRGLARVHFTKDEGQWRTIRRHGRSRREYTTVTVHYRWNEDYFYHRVPLFDLGGERFQLAEGRHQYRFSFALPDQIPSSFEGVHGHVRYTLRVVMQRPNKGNQECKIPFTVNTLVDLNRMPESTMPASVQDSKTLGFFCCQSGPITAKIWLDRVGYVPGEAIMLNAEVENLSRRKMKGTKLQFVEVTTFHAMGQTKVHERILTEQKRGEFNALELWEDHPVTVPPVAPSNLPFCQIINITYLLRLIVDPGVLSFNLVVPVTLLIGNVPLRSSFANFQRQSEASDRARAVPSLMLDSVSTSDHLLPDGLMVTDQYPDLPPPTYEECMFGADIRDADDMENVDFGAGSQFNPRYLTYAAN